MKMKKKIIKKKKRKKKKMEIKFRCWYDNKMHVVTDIYFGRKKINLFASDIINFDEGILMQNTGLKDRQGNEIFDGDYILYDTGRFKSLIKVGRGKITFTFKRWNKYDTKWRNSTYQGIDVYGQVIGNIYEGIKFKKIENEILKEGIEI